MYICPKILRALKFYLKKELFPQTLLHTLHTCYPSLPLYSSLLVKIVCGEGGERRKERLLKLFSILWNYCVSACKESKTWMYLYSGLKETVRTSAHCPRVTQKAVIRLCDCAYSYIKGKPRLH